MTTNAKKQNRILTAALIIIIAALIALIALTSGANRRAKPPVESAPPVGQRYDAKDKSDESAAPVKKPDEDALAEKSSAGFHKCLVHAFRNSGFRRNSGICVSFLGRTGLYRGLW